MREASVSSFHAACLCVVVFTIAACNQGGNVPSVASPPVVPSPAASEILALQSASVVGDLGASSTQLSLVVKDHEGVVVGGHYADPVSVAAAGTHVLLSADAGVTKNRSLVLNSGAQAANLSAYYDGGGGSGYAAALTATAANSTSVSSTLNTLRTTGNVVFGNAPTYASGKLVFTAPSQQVKISAVETNFTGTFSLKSTTCGSIAAVAESGAAFSVTSQSFGTCTLTLSDGAVSYPVAVSSSITQSLNTIPPPSGTIAETADPTANLVAQSIAVGSDGNIWYVGATPANGVLGRITRSGAIVDFNLGASIKPSAVISGADGNLWVADTSSNAVLRYTTQGAPIGGALSAGVSPGAMTLGSDGAVWIADSAAGRVTCVTTGGVSASYAIPNATTLGGIAAGPDGALWVTDPAAPFVARVSAGCAGPSAGVVSEFAVPAFGGNAGIVTGPDGALWFTQLLGGTQGALGRISVNGFYSSYNDGDTAAGGAIALGADRNLWFGGCSCAIGRMTPGGSFTGFSSGVSASPIALVTGPDGGIWYTANAGTSVKIGRLQP